MTPPSRSQTGLSRVFPDPKETMRLKSFTATLPVSQF